jgi:hypothetical protein
MQAGSPRDESVKDEYNVQRYWQSLVGKRVSVNVRGTVKGVGSRAANIEFEQFNREPVSVVVDFLSVLVAPAPEDGCLCEEDASCGAWGCGT